MKPNRMSIIIHDPSHFPPCLSVHNVDAKGSEATAFNDRRCDRK